MSVAGKRSSQGDEYQLRVALHWLIRLLEDNSIQSIQVNSVGIPGQDFPVTVDDIVVLYKDGHACFIQAKKNQTDHQAQSFSEKMQCQLRQALQRTCQQVGVGDAAEFPVGEQWMAQVASSGEYWVKDEAGATVCRGNLHTAEVTVPLSEARAKELEQMLSQQHLLGSRTQTAQRYQPTVSLE